MRLIQIIKNHETKIKENKIKIKAIQKELSKSSIPNLEKLKERYQKENDSLQENISFLEKITNLK